MDSLVIMHSMDSEDSKHWVDVTGWPRAHIFTGHKGKLLVLTDEFDTGLPGGPYWLVVCPRCKVTPFTIARRAITGKRKGRGVPSCGCVNPGHENYQGNYRDHFG